MQASRTFAAVDARFIQVTSLIASSHNKLRVLDAIVRGVDLIAYLLLREENQIIHHKPTIAWCTECTESFSLAFTAANTTDEEQGQRPGHHFDWILRWILGAMVAKMSTGGFTGGGQRGLIPVQAVPYIYVIYQTISKVEMHVKSGALIK